MVIEHVIEKDIIYYITYSELAFRIDKIVLWKWKILENMIKLNFTNLNVNIEHN